MTDAHQRSPAHNAPILLDVAASQAFTRALVERVGPGGVARQAPLAALTTFRTGGPADWLVEPTSPEALAGVVAAAREWGVPVTLLGGGSNVLVADEGVRGLVVRPRLMDIELLADGHVRAEAGVTINGLVRWTIGRGLSGLEAWAGTPGTVGGGTYGNAHFQGRLLSELIASARLLTAEGSWREVPVHDMGFGYDQSRLQWSREILVSVDFIVGRGEPDDLRATARASLAFRKRTQPLHMPSAGCIFQNPGAEDSVPQGIPRSAGALIDRAGLKGVAMGGARVSPVHANFIVNEGHASAADIRKLIQLCQDEVAARFGVRLREEIVYLGTFDAAVADKG